MDKRRLYKIAYRKLRNLTPLKYDCGILCGSKCCTGGTEYGMQLFPGEECMLQIEDPFLEIRKAQAGDAALDFAVCKGKCPRGLRPLACRMYPLVPYLDDIGRLSVIPDPRAAYICPLLVLDKDYPIDFIFRRRLLVIFRLLMQDEDIRDFLVRLSGTLRDYMSFTGKRT